MTNSPADNSAMSGVATALPLAHNKIEASTISRPPPVLDVGGRNQVVFHPAGGEAAVNRDVLPGDVGCFVGCEEMTQRGDLLRLAKATQGRALLDEWNLRVVGNFRDGSRQNRAGADGVHGDAAWRKFNRAKFCQMNDRRLRGRISRAAGRGQHPDE